jgi:hypothetical protein
LFEAVLTSEAEESADAEGILIHSVGAEYFDHLWAAGILIKRHVGPPPTSPEPMVPEARFHHDYSVPTLLQAESSLFNQVACHSTFDLESLDASTKPHDVWLALKLGRTTAYVWPDAIQGRPFQIDLTITFPDDQFANVGTFLGPLLEGFMSAFHRDEGSSAAAVRRLAKLVDRSADDCTAWLSDKETAVLGSRTLLKTVQSSGIQWNPAADLRVGALVRTLARPGAQRIACAGRILFEHPLL